MWAGSELLAGGCVGGLRRCASASMRACVYVCACMSVCVSERMYIFCVVMKHIFLIHDFI